MILCIIKNLVGLFFKGVFEYQREVSLMFSRIGAWQLMQQLLPQFISNPTSLFFLSVNRPWIKVTTYVTLLAYGLELLCPLQGMASAITEEDIPFKASLPSFTPL